MNTKTFVIIFVISLFLSQNYAANEEMKELNEVEKKCRKEIGIDEKFLKKIETEKQPLDKIDIKFYCFIGCGFKYYNIMQKDGQFNVKKLQLTMQGTSPLRISRLIKSCKMNTNDYCVNCKNMFTCEDHVFRMHERPF